jgi:hypothetical protein
MITNNDIKEIQLKFQIIIIMKLQDKKGGGWEG